MFRTNAFCPHPAHGQRCVQWRVSAEEWYCRLCGKEATSGHIASDKHVKNITDYGDMAIFYGSDSDFTAQPLPPSQQQQQQPPPPPAPAPGLAPPAPTTPPTQAINELREMFTAILIRLENIQANASRWWR